MCSNHELTFISGMLHCVNTPPRAGRLDASYIHVYVETFSSNGCSFTSGWCCVISLVTINHELANF